MHFDAYLKNPERAGAIRQGDHLDSSIYNYDKTSEKPKYLVSNAEFDENKSHYQKMVKDLVHDARPAMIKCPKFTDRWKQNNESL